MQHNGEGKIKTSLTNNGQTKARKISSGAWRGMLQETRRPLKVMQPATHQSTYDRSTLMMVKYVFFFIRFLGYKGDTSCMIERTMVLEKEGLVHL